MTFKFNRVLLFSACAAVISMFTAAAATCVSGDTLAQYESMYGSTGCQIGDLIFSNFTYTSSSQGDATLVSASSVMVTPVYYSSGDGLEFNASWTADGANSFSDADISFTVTEAGAGGVAISDTGLAQISAAGTGSSASVAEKGCSGTGCAPVWTWGTFTTDGTSYGSTTFGPTSSVTVSKDISAASTGNLATISVVTDTFSEVPEPRAISLLLGLGLVAGFAFRKKFQSAGA